MKAEKEDIAIIGAGPAGAAAAVQLRRSGLDPVLFEKGHPGGLLRSANLVENYPGFPRGIRGKELASLIGKHLERFRIRMIQKEVLKADYRNGAFVLESEGRTLRADYLLLAAGTVPKRDGGLKISGEAAPRVCYDHRSVPRGADTVVIGGSDAAFDYALSLSAENRVLILGRGERVRAIPALAERAAQEERIDYAGNSKSSAVRMENGEVIIELENGAAGRVPERFRAPGRGAVRTEFLLFAIGREPADGFVGGELLRLRAELERRGRLFVAGDMHGGRYRQAAIAAGDGLKAAMRLEERIGS